jgi:proteasome accessory factor B
VDRLERLVNLVAALLDAERPLRASELRERIPGYPEGDGAFRRAFSRDKATLRAMEIPLAVEWLDAGDPENGQGYRIPKKRYELPDPGLEDDEVAALQFASTAVRLEDAQATQAIWKLGGVGASSGTDVDLAVVATASLPGSEHLAVLFGAVADRRTVTFGYRGGPRTVDPGQLSFRNGNWYLAGWDHDRGERRTFRLDRLESPPTLGEPGSFTRSAADGGGPTPPWAMGDERPVEVDVLVDADQAAMAVALADGAEVVERRADGGVVLRFVVTNRAALRTFVLGMLDHAEILSPPAERAALVDWVRAVSQGRS